MRLEVVACMLMLLLAAVVANKAEETSDNDQDEEEYEDIAVAESQDIAHSRLHPNSDSDDTVDRPRTRYRGRKRRRRLRKRPRSTTPSFIEEYNPEKAVKEEETSPPDEEVVYQRRRPSKRRRRPIRRKPEYEVENPETEIVPDPITYEEKAHDYQRPRSSQRRRRKGGRKRTRTSTEATFDIYDSNQDSLQDVTTQHSEVVVQSHNYSSDPEHSSESIPMKQEETTASILTSSFTPKEITEINHKLESLSEYPSPPENDYQVSGLGAFNIYSPIRADATTHNLEENHIIRSSTTTKDYEWITKFDPHTSTRSIEESTTSEPTTYKSRPREDKNIVKEEPQQNIKNIDKIIENRKNLFSKSRRLPPTSAVIRRRIRPRRRNSTTTTSQTITDNTVPTVTTEDQNNDYYKCQSVECALNSTSLISNIIPSSLLPSGFPTMPEVLSTAELIQKMSEKPEEIESSTKHTELSNKDIPHQSSTNVIIITPSTLIRSPSGGENTYFQDSTSEIRILSETLQPSSIQTELYTDISTSSESETKPEGNTQSTLASSTIVLSTIEASSTETVPPTSTTKLEETTETHSTTKNIQSTTEQEEINTSTQETTTDYEDLKLDGVDVSNINDEILELIMDEMGKARVKRILELRNMTLSELIAHRERGAGRFSNFSNLNRTANLMQENNTRSKSSLDSQINTDKPNIKTEEKNDEEKMEKMIVEKAKHFLSEYKKSDESVSSHVKSSQWETKKYGQKLKVEGTVIPVPILEPTHTSIQFPDDGVLGAFPKYMYDIAGKRSKTTEAETNDKPILYTESINKPRDVPESNDKREPRVFDSMPRFSSEASSKDNLEILPYPDWRITVSKSTTERSIGFPGISREILLVPSSTPKTANLEEVILLDEGEEVHHLRNHILGGKINVESGDIIDDDYPETKKVPAGVKSAIAASGALLGLAIFGFLAVLVSCKIRQRRARLRARQDILCEHLADDLRGSQRSLTPVLRKSPFNHGIHSNTASNRHYYLWRTLRKTFQYE